MPVAHLNVLKGHPKQNLQAWVRDASEAMHRVLEAPTDRLEVWVTEADPDLWGFAGEPASEALKRLPRDQVEIPFIQMVLMQGRSTEQYSRIIAELTAITARHLNSDGSRVRIHIADAYPDRWGIGGVPASVKRAAELAARQATQTASA
jgi:4-oxalocrotonate tautomerase family enzyme